MQTYVRLGKALHLWFVRNSLFSHKPLHWPGEAGVTLLLLPLQALAAEYAVTAMPTFAIIQEGQRVGEVIGADKNKLTDLIARWSSHGQQAQQPARV